jgi:alpha-glucosidase
MVLNLGLSGQPFVGPDIGGFADNASADLFSRWMGIGALLPFARGHSVRDSLPHEPWSFGPECEATCRRALERRSRLLPHLYTIFRESYLTGLPIARPLFFADPADPRLRSVDDAFLLGADLLVRCDVWPRGTGGAKAPVLRTDAQEWRRFEPLDVGSDKKTSGAADDPDLPEIYLRPGAIAALGPVMQFDGERPVDPLTLVVAPDSKGFATGALYEDSGDGYGFETGDYAVHRFEAHLNGRSLTVKGTQAEGIFVSEKRETRVVGLLADGTVLSGTFGAG